ncbi:MAG: SGNH/GDSL hydrolase family protein [Lentisphaerota bacterium]
MTIPIPSRLFKISGKLLLLAVGLAFGVACAELILRLSLKRQQELNSIEQLKMLRDSGREPRIHSRNPLAKIVQISDVPGLIFELRPNLEMKFGPNQLRTNGEGMREGRNYPVERTPGSVRILGIGDSGMFGWACEQDENALAVLETNLNHRGDGVAYEVINTGVPGYNTQQEILALKSKWMKYYPDIVLLSWSDNDIFPRSFEPQNTWNRRDVLFLYYLLFDRETYAGLVTVEVKNREKASIRRVYDALELGVDVGGVKQCLSELRGLAESNGFKVLVFGSFHEGLAPIYKETGIPLFDIREQIPEGAYPDEYAIYAMHPRPEGHRVLAGCLEKELDRRGWLK